MNKIIILVGILIIVFIISCASERLSKNEAINIAKTTKEVKEFLEKFPEANIDTKYTNKHRCATPHLKTICEGEFFWEIIFYKEESRPISSQITADSPIEVWVKDDGEILSVCKMYCVMRGGE